MIYVYNFNALVNEIKKTLPSKIKKATNDELFQIYSKDKNNTELRNQIALKNILLIPHIIKKNNLFIDQFHDYDEMISEAFIYLIKAVETFDYSKGYQFSSYAYKVILGTTRGRYDYNKHRSLDEPLNAYEGETTLGDILEDESSSFEDELIEDEFYLQIRAELEYSLTDIEYQVIRYNYGIGGDKKTLKEICKELNISDNKLRTSKERALKKLRKNKFFKDFNKEFDHDHSYIKSSSYFNNDRVTASKDYNSVVEQYLLRKEAAERQYIRKLLGNIK